MTATKQSIYFAAAAAALIIAVAATFTDAFVPTIAPTSLKTTTTTTTTTPAIEAKPVVAAPPSSTTLSPNARVRGSSSSTTKLSMATTAGGGNGNLFDRFTRVVKANLNSLLKGFENPEKVIEQAVDDMQTDLVKIRQAYAEVTASQRRLVRQKQQSDAVADDWYQRAQLALSRGGNNKEQLAREALACWKAAKNKSADLTAQMDAQRAAADRLYAGTQALESKIQEAAAKKQQLIARARTAKTTAQVNDMLSGVTGKTSMDAFHRMEERVEALEAAAEVLAEMGALSSSSWTADDNNNKKSLEGEFIFLEQSAAVEQELDKLKGKLLLSEAPPVSSSKKKSIPVRQEFNALVKEYSSY